MNLTRMLRKHMNKLLWVLVIFIAVAFGVTATMTDVLKMMFVGHWAEMFGREVSQAEFMNARRRIAARRKMAGYGFEERVKDDDVWEYLVMLEEARRTGIMVSDREIRKIVLEQYRAMRLRQNMWDMADGSEDKFREMLYTFQRLTPQQRQAAFEDIQFDSMDYSRLVSRRLDMTVRDYEVMWRETLLLKKLYSYVTGSALVSSQSVFDKFVEKNHSRKIDYIHLNSENFKSKVEVKEDELQKLYDERKAAYKEPERIAFEYVLARYDEAEKSLPAPTEEELKDFYERKKHIYFWDEDARDPGPGETPGTQTPVTPGEKYKPYEDVKLEVKELYLNDNSRKKARELVESVRDELNSFDEISLLKSAEIAAGKGLKAGETKPFSIDETMWKLEDVFGRCLQAERMFDSTDKVGGKFEGPHTCDKGIFIYKLSKHLPEQHKPLAEVRDEILQTYINQQSAEAAKENAELIVEQARVAKSFSDKLLLDQELARVSTDFFKTVENQGDIKTIEDVDLDVINTAYGIEEIGGIADPVEVNVAGKKHFFIIQYKARREPPESDFLSKREDLIGEQKQENQSELFDKWKENMMSRADVKKIYLEARQEEEAGQEPEGEPGEEQPSEENAEEQPGEKSGEEKPETESSQETSSGDAGNKEPAEKKGS